MTALADEQLDALVPAEVFGWALGLGGMTDALREYGRAVADAAVQAAREGQEPVAFKRFLTDVVTAAGLVAHGKKDKGLASRISEAAYAYMTATTPPAATVVPEGYVLVPVELIEKAKRAVFVDDMFDVCTLLAAAKAPKC